MRASISVMADYEIGTMKRNIAHKRKHSIKLM